MYWKANNVPRRPKLFPVIYEDQSVVVMFAGSASVPHPVPNESSPHAHTPFF